jgi:hypothetical protein
MRLANKYLEILCERPLIFIILHDIMQVVSFAAATLCWLTLYFITTILLHIVDAVFVCYAFDREYNLCSQPDVHEVYAHLPGAGGCPGDAYLVTHPDGSMAYAPQMNKHFNHPYPGLNYQYCVQSPQYGSPMHQDRILQHPQLDSGPAYYSSGASSRYPVVQPVGSSGFGELMYDAPAGPYAARLSAAEASRLQGHAHLFRGNMFAATGGAASYWYQPSTQQTDRLPPGPSPLYYSPSFNAEQAHLAAEVVRGFRNEGHVGDDAPQLPSATAVTPSDK